MMKLRNLFKKTIKRNCFLIFIFLLFVVPKNVFALSDSYIDRVASITSTEIEEGKINLYLFKGVGCPHCAEEEEWLDEIKEDYREY